MSKSINDFTPGDLLLITNRSNRGEEVCAAEVSIINYNGNKLVTYMGRHDTDFAPTGQGAFDPSRLNNDGIDQTKKFGFCCKVEKVGHHTPWASNQWSPRPGDRGYDLMC